jgi:hypothetical protein
MNITVITKGMGSDICSKIVTLGYSRCVIFKTIWTFDTKPSTYYFITQHGDYHFETDKTKLAFNTKSSNYYFITKSNNYYFKTN